MKKKIFSMLLFFAFTGLCFAKEAKNALLIANGRYEKDLGALTQPEREAEALKVALESIGFKVTLVKNANLEQMQKALSSFKQVTRGGGIALFHYGGHAVQIDGINYLIPLNARLEDKESVRYRCVYVDEVMNSLKGDANVVILDSCRDNPFAISSHRGTKTRGLAAVSSKQNSIVVYSAASGQTAQDGVFTPILTRLIVQKNKTIETVLREVRSEVYQKTNGEQEPADYTKLMVTVYIAGIDNTAPTPSPLTSDIALARPPAKPPVPQGNSQIGKDLTYNVKGVSFTMKHIASVQDAVLGDDNQSDNKGHKVSLSSYYIGETEVTQELWQAVMGSNPSCFKDSLKNPVERVTWFDCIGFCNELTVAVMGDDDECVYDMRGNQVVADFSKKGFRLPTEAEWEYAAMGGKGQRYAGCNIESQLKAYAWYDDNSGSKTHEVATKKANKYGLYDMSGNVWEWCWDWYSESTPSAGKDPVGASSGSNRVIRGGCWNYDASYCECAFRYFYVPSFSYSILGLRLACRL